MQEVFVKPKLRDLGLLVSSGQRTGWIRAVEALKMITRFWLG